MPRARATSNTQPSGPTWPGLTPAGPPPAGAGVSRPRTGESARSLLNTVLGEFVYPAGGGAWTQTFIEALGLLEVDEKAARQALARTAADGWLERERHGRRMRWFLSPQGLQRCIDGTARIESFGGVRTDWDGRWLLVFVSVPEEQRALGHRLRRRLTWAGFGSLGQGAWITPHVALESEAARILSELPTALRAESFVASYGSIGRELEIAADAWDLDELRSRYRAFLDQFRSVRPRDDAGAFVAQTRLVHEWRRFAFGDPVLPVELLPAPWLGAEAKALVDARTEAWLPRAMAWFQAAETASGC
jgi:phenylacetic acid degradation operon negative regulatory protein